MFSPNILDSNDSHPMPTPSLPQASLLLKIISWIVIIGCVTLTALVTGVLVAEPLSMCSPIGEGILICFFGTAGTSQYLATFRSSQPAAHFVYKIFLCTGGLFVIVTLSNSAEWAIKGNRGPNSVSMLVLIFARVFTITALSFWFAWLNLGWSKELKAHKPKIKVSYQISLREMFMLLSLLGLFMGIVSYAIRTTPPLFAEHLTAKDAPKKLNLPSDANDVCYRRVSDSLYCEFTISEEGFRNWIIAREAGKYILNLERIPVPCMGPMHLSRYKRFLDSQGQPVEIEITNGLTYNWSDEYTSERVIYDCDSKRAYYESVYTD